MFSQEKHEMKLLHRHENCSEEWRCSECGRHILLEIKGRVKQTVMNAGNNDVAHYGGKFGKNISATFSHTGNKPGQPSNRLH